jgi:hypothetical protein
LTSAASAEATSTPDLHEVYLGGFIMGHEPAGRIARVGRDVSGWRDERAAVAFPDLELRPDVPPWRGHEERAGAGRAPSLPAAG